MNILFVCSMNKWRSPTAEQIFRKVAGIQVRSAGTSRTARRPIKAGDVDWADLICVMEEKHLARLRAEFRNALKGKETCVLDIPDEYRYMDPELVDLLTDAIAPLIERAE